MGCGGACAAHCCGAGQSEPWETEYSSLAPSRVTHVAHCVVFGAVMGDAAMLDAASRRSIWIHGVRSRMRMGVGLEFGTWRISNFRLPASSFDPVDVKRREFPGSRVRPAPPGIKKARSGGIFGFQLPAPLRREELGIRKCTSLRRVKFRRGTRVGEFPECGSAVINPFPVLF